MSVNFSAKRYRDAKTGRGGFRDFKVSETPSPGFGRKQPEVTGKGVSIRCLRISFVPTAVHRNGAIV